LRQSFARVEEAFGQFLSGAVKLAYKYFNYKYKLNLVVLQPSILPK